VKGVEEVLSRRGDDRCRDDEGEGDVDGEDGKRVEEQEGERGRGYT
jgi:hypothetical protein